MRRFFRAFALENTIKKKHKISSCEHKESAAMQRRSLNLNFFAQPILLQDQKKSNCAMQMLS